MLRTELKKMENKIVEVRDNYVNDIIETFKTVDEFLAAEYLISAEITSIVHETEKYIIYVY